MPGLLDAANTSTLNCIYFSSLVSGLILALVSLLMSGFGGEGADGGVEFDGNGADGGDLVIFSPVTIGAFLAVFGGVGLIATVGFGVAARPSLVIAGVSAAAISLLVAFVYGRLLVELHGSTDISERDMVGVQAVVSTPIPATGLGEVRFEVQGERMSRPARSDDSAPIARGSTVVIEQVLGAGVLVVRQHPPAS